MFLWSEIILTIKSVLYGVKKIKLIILVYWQERLNYMLIKRFNVSSIVFFILMFLSCS